ncbi:MAG: dTDP-glucose 4,6-dehydratase [Deltaproteobacteria bacterium]|nr:dTDP-glucose 4,6-dehydratase [Deltaproteobacteria bacterium]
MTVLVTGGAGFIGTNFILRWLAAGGDKVVNLDKLTYAGNRHNLSGLSADRHELVQADIGDREAVDRLLAGRRPRAVVNFAAESHVDRSIHGPADFVETNVVGTFNLLESVRGYWGTLRGEEASGFRFLHVSTDEVYGSLTPEAPAFTEDSPYAPNSPYSATKAASDHLVRAYRHTYGLPTLTTNCSNNYGPYQFPEKLVPLMILNGLEGRPLPVYGDGRQVRDWLHVHDHVRAIALVLERGRVGGTYNIGGRSEKSNLEVVLAVCRLLDELAPDEKIGPRERLVAFVADRPGHDRRYAVDFGLIASELGFEPSFDFVSGLRATVGWYLANRPWVESVTSGGYRSWIDQNYGESRGAAARAGGDAGRPGGADGEGGNVR